MMKELQRGPIACGILAGDDLEAYTGGIISAPKKETWGNNHAISVVGYGVENGIPFWKVRNSWGAYWGEHGFFRITRGENTFGIEEDCSYAIP